MAAADGCDVAAVVDSTDGASVEAVNGTVDIGVVDDWIELFDADVVDGREDVGGGADVADVGAAGSLEAHAAIVASDITAATPAIERQRLRPAITNSPSTRSIATR